MDWVICKIFLFFSWTLLLLVNKILILKSQPLHLKLNFSCSFFSSKLAVNFDLVTYLRIFCSIPNGSWSQWEKFDMLMLSAKRDLVDSVCRIKFKCFCRSFLCFKLLFVFSQKSSLTWIPWMLFDPGHIFERVPPKSAFKIKPEKSLQILSAQNSSLVFR